MILWEKKFISIFFRLVSNLKSLHNRTPLLLSIDNLIFVGYQRDNERQNKIIVLTSERRKAKQHDEELPRKIFGYENADKKEQQHPTIMTH